MMRFNEKLKENISEIVVTVRKIEKILTEKQVLQESVINQIAHTCTRLALLAMAASDELEVAGAVEDRLVQREVATALWQMALHFIDIQQGCKLDELRYHFKLIGKHSNSVLQLLGLPEPLFVDSGVVEGKPSNDSVITRAQPMASPQDDGNGVFSAGSSIAVPLNNVNEEERLRREVKSLREILSSLLLKRDHLLLVESKELEAWYLRELGNLEIEVFYEESNARYLQRKYELLVAAVNRSEKISREEVENKLKEQAETFRKAYEEYMRHAQETNDTVRQRRENVKNAANKNGQEEKRNEDAVEADDVSNVKDQRSEEEPPEGEKRLKQLYRKLVKAMHPDLHPDQDDKTKELFKRVIHAYETGDLQTLEEIDSIINGFVPEESGNPYGALLVEKQRLLQMIQSIRAQIFMILGRFPFTKRELLNDPARLKLEREKLEDRLIKAKEKARAYNERIIEIERQQNG
ncbi:MAG: J domain-containing protein [Oscillospiraceae bacterium]|nr:J domain-containing protein [Oscillospiraceae bacterium]